jgi:hypothetical protein
MRALHSLLIGFGLGCALLLYGAFILLAALYAMVSGRHSLLGATTVVLFFGLVSFALGSRVMGSSFELIREFSQS